MAISHVNTSHSQTTGTNSLDITMPSGLADGDVVLVGVSCATNTDETLSENSGTWTKLGEVYANDENRDTNFAVWLKVVTASQGTITITCTSTANWAAVVTAYRGVDNSTPQDATAVFTSNKDSPDPDPGSITTVTANAKVVAIGGNSLWNGTWTVPSGYSESVEENGSFFASAILAAKTVVSPGAENPGIFDYSTASTFDSWGACTVALRPASGGGGGIVVPVLEHQYMIQRAA